MHKTLRQRPRNPPSRHRTIVHRVLLLRIPHRRLLLTHSRRRRSRAVLELRLHLRDGAWVATKAYEAVGAAVALDAESAAEFFAFEPDGDPLQAAVVSVGDGWRWLDWDLDSWGRLGGMTYEMPRMKQPEEKRENSSLLLRWDQLLIAMMVLGNT